MKRRNPPAAGLEPRPASSKIGLVTANRATDGEPFYHIALPWLTPVGWVMDFADIKSAFRPLEEELDHRYLNDVQGLQNPTSENIARWVWRRLYSALPTLVRVVVRETCTSGCIYGGEDE